MLLFVCKPTDVNNERVCVGSSVQSSRQMYFPHDWQGLMSDKFEFRILLLWHLNVKLLCCWTLSRCMSASVCVLDRTDGLLLTAIAG